MSRVSRGLASHVTQLPIAPVLGEQSIQCAHIPRLWSYREVRWFKVQAGQPSRQGHRQVSLVPAVGQQPVRLSLGAI